jgi:hypothetical protein
LAGLKKTQLKYDRDQEFFLAGLVTALPDYRLAWYLNKNLGIRFIRQKELNPGGSSAQASFSFFECEQALTHSVFYLIQNKYEGTYFSNEWKKADYFLMIRGSWFMERAQSVIDMIKKIEDIQAVIAIDPDSIKNKDLFQVDV